MSRLRLERMHAEMRRSSDEACTRASVTIVARNGKLVDLYSYGKHDLGAGLPMQPDTIFRICSMSKIVTSVAALVLLEARASGSATPWTTPARARPHEGDDPAARPRSRSSRTRGRRSRSGPVTHSSGLIYGSARRRIDKILRDARVEGPPRSRISSRASRGCRWPTSPAPRFATGCGSTCSARWSRAVRRTLGGLRGADLPAAAHDGHRLLRSRAKRGRIATIYEKGKDGKLAPAKLLFAVRPEPGPKLEAGGAGLFSTVFDYARFMQMLLGGGQLEGTRVLSRKTVELMMANHLSHMERKTIEFDDYDGFGLGGAVRIDLARGNLAGSLGEFGWSGAATTLSAPRSTREAGDAGVRSALPPQRARPVLAVLDARVRGDRGLGPMRALLLVAALAAPQAPEAEVKVVEYLKAHVRPGERVVVSQLYNEVFTGDAERAALNRLFNTFFKLPLYLAQYQKAAGKPPTLAEISEQFAFHVPGEADLMLRIMESDPRMPNFIRRNPLNGEIVIVDVERVLAHPRFGKALERTIGGWEGRPAPAFSATDYDGKPVGSAELAGKPHLLYFWFTNCPPCVRTSPLLAELDRTYAPKGFRIVGLNADRVLELPYGDASAAPTRSSRVSRFTLAHLTPEVQEAYGSVSVFPTLFFVDAKGTIVKHFVNQQDTAALEAAVRLALE